MKSTIWIGGLLGIFALAAQAGDSGSGIPETDLEHGVLVFSRTDGYRHASIEPGRDAIEAYGREKEVFVYATEDASVFTDDNLARFDAVLFLNTTQNVFDNDGQRGAFKRFIQGGGGFAGVHAALDTEYDWRWYNELVGGYFESHPPVQQAVIEVVDRNHPATEMLPERWERRDEWYNIRDFNEKVEVLMRLDTGSFEGSAHGDDHPIAWYHEYDGGRAFYTGLGHTIESYTEDELFMNHLWGGLEYVMGIEKSP